MGNTKGWVGQAVPLLRWTAWHAEIKAMPMPTVRIALFTAAARAVPDLHDSSWQS